MDIHKHESKHFNNVNELILYQQREIRRLLSKSPATVQVKSIQFHYNDLSGVMPTEESDMQSYGVDVEEDVIIDIDPLSNPTKREPGKH